MSIRQALLSEEEDGPCSVEAPFFEHVRLANGVFRTTAPHRLDDVNAAVLPFVAAYGTPRILDVGASSGIASAEWSQGLLDAKLPHSIYVSDRLLWGVAVQHRRFAFLYEPGAAPHLLQIDIGNAAFPNASPSRWRKGVCRLASWIASHRRLIKAAKPVLLVGPAIRQHAKQYDDVHFLEFDVLRPPAEPEGSPYQVIRAANILNKIYFSDRALTQAIRNLFALLDDVGLLIIVRTHPDRSNHASAYVREGARLRRVLRVGSGSECDPLIEALSQSSSDAIDARA